MNIFRDEYHEDCALAERRGLPRTLAKTNIGWIVPSRHQSPKPTSGKEKDKSQRWREMPQYFKLSNLHVCGISGIYGGANSNASHAVREKCPVYTETLKCSFRREEVAWGANLSFEALLHSPLRSTAPTSVSALLNSRGMRTAPSRSSIAMAPTTCGWGALARLQIHGVRCPIPSRARAAENSDVRREALEG